MTNATRAQHVGVLLSPSLSAAAAGRRRIVRYAPLPTLTKGCLPSFLPSSQPACLHGTAIGVARLAD